jgi:hypothetical protein
MPSRWFCAAIIIFWLAVNGWLLWHDLWPRWQPGQPPALTIDLLEQAQLIRVDTKWSIWVGGRRTYEAATWIERERSDLYGLHLGKLQRADLVVKGKVEKRADDLVRVDRLDSTCVVTRDGLMRGLSADVIVTAPGGGHIDAHLEGSVQDGLFHCRYRLKAPFIGEIKGDLDPVPVGHTGVVLLPVHPVQRIRDLWPGRTWTTHSVELLSGWPPGRMQLRPVQARVLDAVENVWWKEQDTPCLVIEYGEGDDLTRTWVARDSGLILRQETTFAGQKWELHREQN